MANRLMFEVGVSDSVQNLDKLKKELDQFIQHYSKDTAIKLKVDIENLQAVTSALSKIGDTPQLRNLRQEIESINKEFSKLAVGAGGVGDLGVRKMNQEVEDLKQKWDSAVRLMARYNQELELARRNRDRETNLTDRQTYTDQINKLKENIKTQQEVINSAKSAYDNAVKNAGQLVDVNTRAEASFREVKRSIDEMKQSMSSMNVNVNIGQDFAKWTSEVQAVSASVRELVEQLQKVVNTNGMQAVATSAQNAVDATKTLVQNTNQEASATEKAAQAATHLAQAEQKGTTQGNIFDPQKFTTLQEAIDKIIAEINRLQQAFTHLGQNGSLSNLSTMINGLAVTLSSLSNAIKIQPLDDQVKALLERCEKAEAKLREVGDAARYLNERAGAKTQQKANTIAGIAGLEDEQVTKVSSTAERFLRLLVEIENQMAKIGKVQALGEQSGFSPTLLKNAQNQLEALKKMVDSTIKGTPIAEGLIIPASDSQLAQFIQQFGLLKAMYRDVVKEADRFNKANEKDSLKQKNQELREQASNMKAAENESRRLTETISNLEALANKASALGVDTKKIRTVIDLLEWYRNVMNKIAQGNVSFSTKATKLTEDFLSLKRSVKEVTQEIKKNMNAALKPDTEQANAFREYAAIIRQISSLTKTSFSADKLGIDITQLNNYINKLNQYAQVLEQIARNGGVGFTAWKQSSAGVNYLNVRAMAGNEQAAMNAKIAEEKSKNDTATRQLTESEKRFADAIKHSTDSMKGQSQVLSDLKMMAMQYLSVWGAQTFIDNIIKTGGLLEQQRLSIGAILQNAGQATELFDKIKALAIQSPFGVVELDRMSKQLTAYGFEYKELYDWTKRLGDISAATGTGVDRLALALGHVRSEGALSGYTLRQFAMGNVPVLRMLSENLGISTKQVREKVRKKEISYEDVQNVLKQLTDEGGMFYQAQETMSQALNAKFKNLHDAFDIMYGEIAESGVGDALKRLAEILTAGAKEWGRYAKDIMGVAAAFGIAKVAMLAYNTVHAKGVHTSLTAIAAAAKEERENIRLAATYRNLDAAEKAAIANKSALARGWYSLFAPMKLVTSQQLATAISTKKITQEELLRAVAMRKLNIEKAKAAILESNLGRAQKANMLGTLNQVKILSRWRIAWIGVGNALKGVLSIAKSFAPLMVISAVMDMFARVSEMKSQAEEASAALAEKAASDMKVLNETFKELQSSGYIKQFITNTDKFINGKRVVANLIEFDDDLLNKTDLTQEIETLKAKLQDLSPMYEGDLVDIDKMDNQLEQFKLIVRKLESIRHANDVTEAMSDVVTDANVQTAGNDFTKYISDTFTEDVKDYEDRLKKFEKEINAIDEQTIENIDKQLGGQLDKLKKKYSLDSKNNALAYLFKQWAQGGGLPDKFHSSVAPTKIEEFYNSAVKGGFSRSLTEQYDEMVKGAKEMAETLSSIVVNQFASDPEGAMYAISTYINKLMSMAKVTDPRVVQSATQLLLNEMRKNVPSYLQESVIDEMQRKMLMEQFMGFLGNTITDSTTPEEAEKALNRYTEMTIQWGEQMGWDLKKIGMDNAEAYRDGIQAKMNSVKLKVDWQKRAKQYFVVNTVFKTNIDKNLDEFAQAVQKDLKEKQAYLDRNKQHLKMTFNIDTDIIMNADKLKAFMDNLAEQGQKKAMEGDWEGAQAIYSKIDKELKPYYDALMSVQEDKSWLKAEGFPEKDPTKGNKGSQEDKDAKDLRERMRILKEAADAYKYWKDKVGEGSAEAHVNEEFGEVLKKMGYQFKDVQQLRETIQKEIKRYQDIYDKSGKKRPQLLEAIKEGYKTDAGLNRNEFEQDTEDWASALTRDLEELTRKWEIFNSVVSDTGDRVLAARLTGITPGATPADLKRLAVSQFAGARIDFDSVLGMSGEEIDHYVENLGVAEDKIKAVQNGLKEWKKAQEDVTKSDLQNYAKWLGSLVDLESIRMRNQEEYNRVLEETNRLLAQGLITQEEAERRRAAAATNKENKDWQATTLYSSLYNNSRAMAEGDFYAAYNREMASLNDQLKAGTIDMNTYADKVAKLNKITAEFRMDGFLGIKGGAGAYLSGGYQGLIDYHRNRAIEKRKNNDEEGAKQEEETAESMEKAQKAAEQLTKVFQDLSSGADMVANLFEALGMDGAANAFGDAAGVLGGISQGAQSLSALGPWGMAAGAALGGITSLMQLSDKNHERRIQELKQEVTKIDSTLNTIKALRERELGYYTGTLRSQMKEMYNGQQSFRKLDLGGGLVVNIPGSAVEGMKEYYGRFSGSNGYSQDYTALIETRKKYLEMYDEENAKKKSSEEALEEYKVKIAELDEKIMYYIEDLSKELWGIDFQSWADQISDALWTAFENGESAVEAFHDTAKDIIADVAKKMMNIHLIEPLFNQLEEQLFGKYDAANKRYTGGAIKYDSNGNINMQESEPDVLRILGQFFGEGGSMEKNVEAAEQFYNWVQDITGLDFSSDDSKSTGTSIKSITEETADLLASYLNATRASVAKIEGMQAQYLPLYYDVMTRGNSSLTNIENHTAAIMRSNDAIQRSVDDLYRDFHGLRTSAWKMPIA